MKTGHAISPTQSLDPGDSSISGSFFALVAIEEVTFSAGINSPGTAPSEDQILAKDEALVGDFTFVTAPKSGKLECVRYPMRLSTAGVLVSAGTALDPGDDSQTGGTPQDPITVQNTGLDFVNVTQDSGDITYQQATHVDDATLTYELWSGVLSELNDVLTIENGVLEATGTNVGTLPLSLADTKDVNVLVKDPEDNKAIYAATTAVAQTETNEPSNAPVIDTASFEENSDGVLFSWSAVSFNSIPGGGYEVEITNTSTSTVTVQDVGNVTQDRFSVDEGVTYEYRVRAYNDDGPGPYGIKQGWTANDYLEETTTTGFTTA